MAEEKTKKKSTSIPEEAEPEEVEKKPEKKMTAKDIDPDQYVVVRNGFQGRLVYRSPRTRERFIWDSFGAEQEMQLRELRNAKNSYKKFFTNNWFMFDDEWVVDYLGLRQYYKNAFSVERFDDIFKKTPSELKKFIKDLTPSQKRSIAYRASVLISSGEIDSRKTVNALEEALGIELAEK